MKLGSVCRHLKIAGRVIISRFFHVTQPPTRTLQHIRLTCFVPVAKRKLDAICLHKWLPAISYLVEDSTQFLYAGAIFSI